MRKLGTLLAASALGLIGAFALVSPASAATVSDTRTATVQINERPDSATDGSTWAHDTFKRSLTIVGESIPQEKIAEATPQPVSTECAVILENKIMWKYTVTGTDLGTFKTTASNKSPQQQKPMKANVTGKFAGDFKFYLYAPAAFCSYKAPQATMNDAPSTSQWSKLLFPDAQGNEDFTNWKWTYTLCNEHWVNADKSRGGNKGDITGLSAKFFDGRNVCKEVVFKDTCDGVTVTLKNNAPSENSVIIYKIGETEYPVKGGASQDVKIAAPTSEVVVFVKVYGKWIKFSKHTWVKPNCEVTPTVPPTIPPTTAPPVADKPTLPKTGFPVGLASGLGGIVVAAGIALYFIARRRRVVTELPE